MRLIQCHIENFGKLSGIDIPFSSGCTVICKDNGWGKSTLASFIKVMFYGFDNERSRDDYVNERRRFRPWQGGVYGGSLVFEAGGKEYVLTRTFGLKEKEDTFSLRDRKTNLESMDYTKRIGEELFSIDLNSFERTVFLSQNDCITEATDRIYARIGDMAENLEDGNQFEKVNQRLMQLLNSMSPDRKTGSIYKKKEQIAWMEMEKARGKYLEESIQRIHEQKKMLKDSYEEMRREQRRLTEEKKKVRESMEERIRAEQVQRMYLFSEEEEERYRILNELLCEQEEDREKMMAVVREEECFSQLREQARIEEPKNREGHGFFLIAFGLFCSVAGVLWQIYRGFPGIAVAAGGMIVSVVCFLMIKNREKQWREMAEEFEFRNIRNLLEDAHEELTEKYIQYQSALQCISGQTVSMEMLDEQSDDILTSLEEVYREQAECETAIEELTVKRRELYEMEETLKVMKESLKEEEEKYRLLKLTREYLLEAKASFASRYMEPLRRGFSCYYHGLTGEEADAYVLDTNLVLTKWEQAKQREIQFFSAGYQDLIGLCMRMALVDAMYREEKPFLVLDDPFVNLDEQKLQGAKKLLEVISEKYQLIYFICHESRNVFK